MSVIVRRAGASDRDAAAAITVAAFVTEPAIEYFFQSDYSSSTPPFFEFLFDVRMATGQIWIAEHDSEVAAVAMWNTPDDKIEGDEPVREWDSVACEFSEGALRRLDTYGEYLDAHRPIEPHHYLGVIATRPDLHGHGLGSAVLQPMLTHLDETGGTAYLETGTEANLKFYVKHGFEIDAEVDLPDGPRIWWMRRPSQSK
ncbi:MAG: GNAT family N-acetyltransferase [Candidatus Nanopelagicales bacterium]